MGGDWFWIGFRILLCALVMAGYWVIAKNWREQAVTLHDGETRRALMDLMRVFILCGMLGYGFNIVTIFWPGWKLYCFAMLFLVFFTGRYIQRMKQNVVRVFDNLRRSETEAADRKVLQAQVTLHIGQVLLLSELIKGGGATAEMAALTRELREHASTVSTLVGG